MYLPKSKYQGNLKAAPGSLKIKATGEPYEGMYFKTYEEKLFSGTTPSSQAQELTSNVFGISENLAIDGESVIGIPNEYDVLRNNDTEVKLKATLPVPLHYPKPGNVESFTRYFAIDKTSQRVVEVSKDTYLSIKSQEPKYYYPKYELKTLQWSLTNVAENRINASIEGLDSYLKDPSQFVR